MSRQSIPGKGQIICQGWLQKRGPMVGFRWEDRWCVLTQKEFEYFHDDSCQEKHGSFPIESYTSAYGFANVLAPGDAVRCSRNHEFGFVFDPLGSCAGEDRQLYYFNAKSKVQLAVWLKGIQMAAAEALPKEPMDLSHVAMLVGLDPCRFLEGADLNKNEQMLMALVEKVGKGEVHVGAVCRAATIAQKSCVSIQNLFKILASCADYDSQILNNVNFGICLRVPQDPLAQASVLVPVKLLKSTTQKLWSKVGPFVSLKCLGYSTEQWVDWELGVVKLFFDGRPGVPVAVGNMYEFGGRRLLQDEITTLCKGDVQRWLLDKISSARTISPEREALWQALERSFFNDDSSLRDGVQFRASEAVVRISSREVSRDFADRWPFYVKTTMGSSHPAVLATIAEAKDKTSLLETLRVAEELLRVQKSCRDAEKKFNCNLGSTRDGSLRKSTPMRELIPHLVDLRRESPMTLCLVRASQFVTLVAGKTVESHVEKMVAFESQQACQNELTTESEIKAKGLKPDVISQSHNARVHSERRMLLLAAENARLQLSSIVADPTCWVQFEGFGGTHGHQANKSKYADCVVDFGLKTVSHINYTLDRHTWLCTAGVNQNVSASASLTGWMPPPAETCNCSVDIYDMCSYRFYYDSWEAMTNGMQAFIAEFRVLSITNRCQTMTGVISPRDIQLLVEIELDDCRHIVEFLLSLSRIRNEHEETLNFHSMLGRILQQACKPKMNGFMLQAYMERSLMNGTPSGLQMHDIEWDKPNDRGIIFIVQGVEKQEHHHIWSCADKGPRLAGRFFKECTEGDLMVPLQALIDDLSTVRLLCFANVLLRMVYV